MSIEMNTPTLKTLKKQSDLLLRSTFAHDLQDYLTQNPFLSVKAILRHMGNVVDESTLRRNLRQKTTPSAKTLRAFYAFKFKEERDDILLELVPKVVKDVLQKHYHIMQTPFSTGNQSKRVDMQIVNDLHFAELYAFTAFEQGTTLETIQDEFGKRAISKINEMIAAGVLIYDPKTQRVYPGKNRSTYSKEAVQALAQASIKLSANNVGVKEDEQMGMIQFANLNTTALKRLIEIDQAAHREKLAIINDPRSQGEHKVFTTSFIESFSANVEYNSNEVLHVH